MTKEIGATVKDYILKQFLPGQDPDELTDSTPLITGGILDSVGVITLVAFLEEQFGIEVEAHEMDVGHLGTIESINELVGGKLAGTGK